MNRYRILGSALLLLGLTSLPAFYLASRSVPLLSVGTSLLILGLTSISLAVPTHRDQSKAGARIMVSLSIIYGGTTAMMTLIGQNDFAVYLIAFALSFLVVVLLTVSLPDRSRAGLNRVASVIFVAFLVAVVMKVIQTVR